MFTPSTVIKNQYQGQQLMLLQTNGQDHADINWDQQVLRISNAQLETIDMGVVLNVLSQTARPPSEMAGIPLDEVAHDVITLLDAEHRVAMLKYRNNLTHINPLDANKAAREAARLGWVTPTTTGGGIIAGGAVTGAVAGLVAGPVGAAVGAGLGAIICGLLGLFGGRKAVQLEVEHAGSAHRVKWLVQVDEGENKRLEEAKNKLINACIPLLKELSALKAKGEFDEKKYKQLQQLQKVFKALFPEEELKIGDQPLLIPGRPVYLIENGGRN